MQNITRRDFLKLFGVSAGALAITGLTGCGVAPFLPGMAQPVRTNSDFIPDVELQLTATATQASILPGQPTRVWKYDGAVLATRGDSASLQTIPNSYLGPIIRAKRGQKNSDSFKECAGRTDDHSLARSACSARSGWTSTLRDPARTVVHVRFRDS